MRTGKPLDRTALKSNPLPPVVDGDKETKGRILIVAGSREIPGAALLAATAAMRAGAGKLRIMTAKSIAPRLAVAMPEAMVIGLEEDKEGGLATSSVKLIVEAASKVDSIVAGPGMSDGPLCAKIADALLKAQAAVALDAAMLRNLNSSADQRPVMPVLLPHSGELASLLDCDEKKIALRPIDSGIRAAELYRSVVLVKGVVSHVVTPAGDAWTYKGGSPGLGVSGSGDVLAGIVGGLLARGAPPLAALMWAVWLHGQAGARLAKKIGPIGFLAREISDQIPALLPR